jgi:Flp pilus assembly protein TadG
MHAEHQVPRSSERGVTLVFVAVLLVGLIGISALAVDLGSALVTKAELQNVADAATLAANRELALVYKDLGTTTNYKTYQLTSADKARIQAKAATFAGLNKAGGVSISILPADITYGTYNAATGAISSTSTGVRAVALKTRRDATANGAVSTLLAGVLGINTMTISASSAAGISPVGAMPAGYGDVPIGISSYWFQSNACGPNSAIRFYPTGDLAGCAGWHTFTESPASASRIKTIIDGLKAGTYQTPATTAGVTYYTFTGGTVASRISDLKELYDQKKDASGNWRVTIPVYKDNDCSNPNGSELIVGFARARIYDIKDAPTKIVSANVECGVLDGGIGNGPNDYGTLVGIPGMIQ